MALIYGMSLQKLGCLLFVMIGTFSTLRTSLTDHDFTSEYIVQEDLTKAARKVGDAKKHESM